METSVTAKAEYIKHQIIASLQRPDMGGSYPLDDDEAAYHSLKVCPFLPNEVTWYIFELLVTTYEPSRTIFPLLSKAVRPW